MPNPNFPSERPTDPSYRLVDCPACRDESGEPTGDALVRVPSGTWVRKSCDLCSGSKKVDETARAFYLASDPGK